MLLYQILASPMHGKIKKKLYKNNIFKVTSQTWNDKFQLPDGSHSVSNTQDCSDYIIKTISN